jgi:hypothetical protein
MLENDKFYNIVDSLPQQQRQQRDAIEAEYKRWAVIEMRFLTDKEEHEKILKSLCQGDNEVRIGEGFESDVVSFNVGGRLVSFRRVSLLCLRGSYFEPFASSRWRQSQTALNAPPFVDRDPRLFERYIAPFIRGKRKFVFKEQGNRCYYKHSVT